MQLSPEELQSLQCRSDAGRWMSKEFFGTKLTPLELQGLECPSEARRDRYEGTPGIIPTHFGPHQEKTPLRPDEVSWIIAGKVRNLSGTN